MSASIKILSSKEIDRKKWDACVERNENGLIYARSFFVDAMATHWDGLIVNNYEAVMPLPWTRKWGIKYLQMLPFAQQLGVIGNLPNATNLFELLQKQYKYGTIAFNFLNKPLLQTGFAERINLVLDLNNQHELIFKKFSETLRQELRKATNHQLFVEDATCAEVIEMYKKFLSREKNITIKFPQAFERFENMCAHLSAENTLTKKVVSAKNETLAMALYLKDEKRIYNIMAVTTREGKAVFATHFLINHVIKTFAGSNLLFDFEGSELPGVRGFYEKFSPVNQPYFLYKYNHLPRLLRMFKKQNLCAALCLCVFVAKTILSLI